jgi:hypothetical protein
MKKSTKKMPILLDPPQDTVRMVMEQTVCDECGDYRDKGEYAVFQLDKKDWDRASRAILCSWECSIDVTDRKIVHSRIVYGMDADQERKYELENPGRQLGDFSYPKGHPSWEKLVEFKRKMEAL